jgi:hypothetical protein
MYWQRPRHPRAGLAVGAAILAAWAGVVALDLATSDSTADDRGSAASGAVATPPLVAPAPGAAAADLQEAVESWAGAVRDPR